MAGRKAFVDYPLALSVALATVLAVVVASIFFGTSAPAYGSTVAASPPASYIPPFPLVYPIDAPRQFADTFGAPRDGGERLHQGGDLFAPKMAPVLAAADGWVNAIEWSTSAGFYIEVTHASGWRTRYLHLNNDSPGTDDGLGFGIAEGIGVGTSVAAGQPIGYVGDSGNAESSSPHLHFELRMPDWTPVNPYPFVIGRSSPTTLYTLPTIATDPVTVGIDVVGHAEPVDGLNGDVWAHDGVAYVGTIGRGEACPSTGVRMYDVTDPSAPVEIGSISDGHEGTSAEQVWAGSIETGRFSGDLAIVAHRMCAGNSGEGFRGFAIFSVSDPANPVLLSSYHTGPNTAGVNGFDVWVDGDRVLVVAAVPNSFLDHMRGLGDVRIVDISDPTAPVDVADWDFRRDAAPAERDAVTEGSDGRALFASSVTVDPEGRRAFVSHWDAGVIVLDIATPEQPQMIGRTGSIGHSEGMSSSTSFNPETQQLVVNHADLDPLDDVPDTTTADGPEGGDSDVGRTVQSWGRQVLFDVSGERPLLVGTLSVAEALPDDDGAVPLDGIYSVGDSVSDDLYLFSAWLTGGLRVVDLAAEDGAIEVGLFLPPAEIDPYGVFVSPNGLIKLPLASSVHVSDDYVYVSDVNTGLWIMRMADAPLSVE